MNEGMEIRDARPGEFAAAGRLLVEVYGGLEGFPRPHEQPAYYEMLADVGRFTTQPETRLLVAVDGDQGLAGCVVYFGDMADYGSGGAATQIRDASGIRLLGVSDAFRRRGIGRALIEACIDRARRRAHAQVILHTTLAMKAAWRMYEQLGFRRSEDLDFAQKDLPVFGFRKPLP